MPFSVAVDASETCLGAVLFQVVDDVEHPICYLSRKLRAAERNYSTLEKEALALVVSVKAFSPYFGAAPVTVWTDHSPLRYIESMSKQNAKLMRWSFEPQRHTLDEKHRPGRLNILPDLLSGHPVPNSSLSPSPTSHTYSATHVYRL